MRQGWLGGGQDHGLINPCRMATRRDILIIKLGALGDVVMATGLVERILRHHAPRRCTLLTSPAYAGLFPGLELKTFDRSSLRSTLATVQWIRRQRFQRVYDLQSNDRSGVMCGLSGIPERVGNHPRFPYNLHPESRYAGQCHIHTRMLEVLEAAGVSTDAVVPCLRPSAADREKVDAWLQNKELAGRKLVVMHAGASARRPEKRWPYFRELAESLAQRGFFALWAGGEDDRHTNADLARVTGVDASATFSFLQLVALTEHAQFAVTNDSGPMHLLACGSIPVYGLFGPSDWRRNHAVGQCDRVLSLNRDEPVFRKTSLMELKPGHALRQLERDGILTVTGAIYMC
ncbi:MAG: glycosyltransferase family 9 protein [Gammaproteobacteria bacterium]|nr:glycosyltransferase family 9 protein [Gammaproteobacteria bacterium]